MKIYHFSDNHGRFDKLSIFVRAHGPPDVFVMTGDFAPDSITHFETGKAAHACWQEDWMLKSLDEFKAIVKDVPVLFVSGNHDFVDLGKSLRKADVNATEVTPTGIDALGYKWAGYRHVPSINGMFMGEAGEKTLSFLTDLVIEAAPDFLLTHAPPYGVLDKSASGTRFGNKPLYKALANGSLAPRYHFFGHIHKQGGQIEEINGVTFVNSATTVQKVEL